MKNDQYRRVRGGRARMIEIYCAGCSTLLLRYQKDGPGQLLRCYLNRIFAPPHLERLQHDTSISEPSDFGNLVCPGCSTTIGTPMRHVDGRLAFRMRKGAYTKKNA